eukprot:Clim_evm132s109 gene=Clim_evmTU132s109
MPDGGRGVCKRVPYGSFYCGNPQGQGNALKDDNFCDSTTYDTCGTLADPDGFECGKTIVPEGGVCSSDGITQDWMCEENLYCISDGKQGVCQSKPADTIYCGDEQGANNELSNDHFCPNTQHCAADKSCAHGAAGGQYCDPSIPCEANDSEGDAVVCYQQPQGGLCKTENYCEMHCENVDPQHPGAWECEEVDNNYYTCVYEGR